MTRQRQHWTKSGHYASAWSAHIHGPVQPMADDRPGFGECARLAITTALIVFAIGSVWALFS